MMHAVWNLLLQNPDFWDEVSKHVFCILRLVCKEFRSSIPVRVAVLHIFRNETIKKVNLFRILPLSVNDVLRIRSPVNFVEAIKIAERKCGGFDNCLAIMQERGLNLWNKECTRRNETKKELDALLRSNGVLTQLTDPIYEAAIKRGILKVAVWRCRYVYVRWGSGDHDVAYHIAGHLACCEFQTLLSKLHIALGHWYKGIYKDVRSTKEALRLARCEGVADHVHVQISNNTLVVGLVSFGPWTADYVDSSD
jgi:hypothetical protein